MNFEGYIPILRYAIIIMHLVKKKADYNKELINQGNPIVQV